MNGYQQKQINRCLQAFRLSEWEQDFISNIATNFINQELSGDQSKKLNQIDTSVAQQRRN